MANLDKFLAIVSDKPSNWSEKAKYREENQDWLSISAEIAIKVLGKLRADSLSQKELAEKMNVSPQYIHKILKGSENLSLETICKLEKALDIKLIQIVQENKGNSETSIEIPNDENISEFADNKPELTNSTYMFEEKNMEYSEDFFCSITIDSPQKEVA